MRVVVIVMTMMTMMGRGGCVGTQYLEQHHSRPPLRKLFQQCVHGHHLLNNAL